MTTRVVLLPVHVLAKVTTHRDDKCLIVRAMPTQLHFADLDWTLSANEVEWAHTARTTDPAITSPRTRYILDRHRGRLPAGTPTDRNDTHHAQLLPERFAFTIGTGDDAITRTGKPLPEALPSALAEEYNDEENPAARWDTDLDVALDTGMAYKFPYNERVEALLKKRSPITVIGFPRSHDYQLAHALLASRYSEGLQANSCVTDSATGDPEKDSPAAPGPPNSPAGKLDALVGHPIGHLLGADTTPQPSPPTPVLITERGLLGVLSIDLDPNPAIARPAQPPTRPRTAEVVGAYGFMTSFNPDKQRSFTAAMFPTAAYALAAAATTDTPGPDEVPNQDDVLSARRFLRRATLLGTRDAAFTEVLFDNLPYTRNRAEAIEKLLSAHPGALPNTVSFTELLTHDPLLRQTRLKYPGLDGALRAVEGTHWAVTRTLSFEARVQTQLGRTASAAAALQPDAKDTAGLETSSRRAQPRRVVVAIRLPKAAPNANWDLDLAQALPRLAKFAALVVGPLTATDDNGNGNGPKVALADLGLSALSLAIRNDEQRRALVHAATGATPNAPAVDDEYGRDWDSEEVRHVLDDLNLVFASATASSAFGTQSAEATNFEKATLRRVRTWTTVAAERIDDANEEQLALIAAHHLTNPRPGPVSLSEALNERSDRRTTNHQDDIEAIVAAPVPLSRIPVGWRKLRDVPRDIFAAIAKTRRGVGALERLISESAKPLLVTLYAELDTDPDDTAWRFVIEPLGQPNSAAEFEIWSGELPSRSSETERVLEINTDQPELHGPPGAILFANNNTTDNITIETLTKAAKDLVTTITTQAPPPPDELCNNDSFDVIGYLTRQHTTGRFAGIQGGPPIDAKIDWQQAEPTHIVTNQNEEAELDPGEPLEVTLEQEAARGEKELPSAMPWQPIGHIRRWRRQTRDTPAVKATRGDLSFELKDFFNGELDWMSFTYAGGDNPDPVGTSTELLYLTRGDPRRLHQPSGVQPTPRAITAALTEPHVLPHPFLGSVTQTPGTFARATNVVLHDSFDETEAELVDRVAAWFYAPELPTGRQPGEPLEQLTIRVRPGNADASIDFATGPDGRLQKAPAAQPDQAAEPQQRPGRWKLVFNKPPPGTAKLRIDPPTAPGRAPKVATTKQGRELLQKAFPDAKLIELLDKIVAAAPDTIGFHVTRRYEVALDNGKPITWISRAITPLTESGTPNPPHDHPLLTRPTSARVLG